MNKILKIAFRNLYRQKRRTMLTVSIIAFGMVAVLLFSSLAGSFKNMMVGQITDSMLGHLQIHRKGYVSSIDNLPLDKMIKQQQMKKIREILDGNKDIEGYSFRILLGGMLSNYLQTTNIKVAAIDPGAESIVIPLLGKRIMDGAMLRKGEILLPELLVKGFGSKTGGDIVLIANNADGSVNGQNLKISGVVEGMVGPSGKYGYIHIDDAQSLLRMDEVEISEVAIRVKDVGNIDRVMKDLDTRIASLTNKEGNPQFELHSWKELTPFYNITRMIDMMTMFIQIILIGIVLISVMNVMVMAVYERVREIGTLSAIGTLPSTIRTIFLTEGLLLGFLGAVTGSIMGGIAVLLAKLGKISIAFGMKEKIPIDPQLPFEQMAAVGAVIIVVAAIAALEPAFKASRLDPVTALRHT